MNAHAAHDPRGAGTPADVGAAEADAETNIEYRIHNVQGATQSLTEIYLIGSTSALSIDEMKAFRAVANVVRISEEYKVLGRHKEDSRGTGFTYQNIEFSQDTLNIFAGLCAVDSPAWCSCPARSRCTRRASATRSFSRRGTPEEKPSSSAGESDKMQ